MCLQLQENSVYFHTSILPPGAGDRELGCIKCFPCSSSSRLSFLLLLFFSFPPSSFHIFFRFLVNLCVLSLFNCKMLSSIAFGASNVALPSTISRKQDHENDFVGARFGSKPDKRNVYARRGPGGFQNVYFSNFFNSCLFLSKNVFLILLPRANSVFWVSLHLLREQSHERRIPPCPRPFFNLTFLTCFVLFSKQN